MWSSRGLIAFLVIALVVSWLVYGPLKVEQVAPPIRFAETQPVFIDGISDNAVDQIREAAPAAPVANPTVAPVVESTSGAAAPANTGMWGPAGPAPKSLANAQPMYHPDGSGTIIGWVVPGPVSSLPAGVCIDYDPRAEPSDGSWISGTYDEIFRAQTSRRVRLTSEGSYNGLYPATIYWTPC